MCIIIHMEDIRIKVYPKSSEKKRVNISIHEDVHQYGKEIAAKLGIDFSKLIETALSKVVLIEDEKGDEE